MPFPLAASSGRAKGLAASLLRARGIRLESAALLLAGYEGTKDAVWVQKEFARRRSRRGVSAGPSPAKQYVRERMDAPDLRDALIEHCVMVDTLETAATWSNLERVYRATRDAILGAIAASGAPGLIGCHVSHVYPEGASLYFTLMARMKKGEELAQYDAVKAAATRAIVDHGGHVSHHQCRGCVERSAEQQRDHQRRRPQQCQAGRCLNPCGHSEQVFHVGLNPCRPPASPPRYEAQT